MIESKSSVLLRITAAYLDFSPFSRSINVVDISVTNTKDGFPFHRNISWCPTPPHTGKSPPVTVRAFWLLPKRPSCPTDASPSSRSVISDSKPSTPVKVVFFRVPLPRMAHVIADQPFASLSRSLPLLACPLCKSQHPDGGICIITMVSKRNRAVLEREVVSVRICV